MLTRKSRTIARIVTAVTLLLLISFATTNASSTPRGSQTARQSAAAFVPEVVTITASKTDALVNDVNGNTLVDPGDSLEYSIVVNNSGDEDALQTLFTDITDDTETAFVAGSLTATPIGRNDAYNVIGNTAIVHLAAAGLLANDIDPDGGTLATSCAPCTTTNGGTVTLNTNGSFTYTPPVGFTGTDTFTYTVTDPDSLTDTGTVTFTVTNRIWWVDSDAAAGDGRFTSPFNTIAAAQTASGANDIVFVYNRGANYTGGFVMDNGERLCGHGSDLQTCSGITPPAGTTFPGTTSNPTIENAGGHGVTLAQNNTINGLTLGNTGSAANFALFGASFGTLNLQVVTINTNNGAISLTTGSTTSSFTSVTSTGGTNNIALTSVNGNIIISTGSLSGASGNAVDIVGGTAAISFGTTIANTTAKAVNIQSKTSGTVSFSSAITSSGSGTGISLLNNTGTTMTFNGNLTLSTGANTAFTATGGGTLNIFIGINAVTTTTGTAVNIANTTIGSSGVTFRSVSSNGGASPGIILTNTGTTGNFTVTGTGAAGTGGTIQNKTGNGIELTTVDGVSFNWMNLTNADNNGILGTTVTDFTMTRSSLTDMGDTLSPDEAAVFFTNLQGTSTFSNNVITNAFDDQMIVYQTGTANLTLFTLNNNTFNGHDNDNDAFRYQGFNNTNATIAFTGNTFVNSDGDFMQTTLENTANLNLTVGGAGAAGNSFTQPGGFAILGGGLTFSPGGGPGWNGRFDFDINNNTISGANTQAINVNLLKPATAGATIDGFIRNNTISNANNNFGGSIQVTNGGLVSQVTVEISGNNITGDRGTAAIYVIGDQGGTPSTGARTDVRVLNNTVLAPNALNTNAVHLNSSTTSANSGTVVCWDMQNNTLAGGGFSGTDTRIRQRFSSQVLLPTYAGGSADVAAVQAYITARGNTGVVSAATQAPGGYFNGACTAPTLAQMTAAYDTIAALQSAKSTVVAAPDTAVITPTLPLLTNDTEPKEQANPKLDTVKSQNSLAAFAPDVPDATTTVGPFTLPPQESTTITFRVVVAAPFPAANNPICNQATISGSNFANVLTDDPSVVGSSDPTCTTVSINADLSITKTDGATTEIPGTSVTYTIVASNAGPNPDPTAVVTDNFPATITGVTWTCVGAGGATCAASGSGNINETVNLPVGGSVTFTAVGTISPAATGTLVNTATVATSAGITDPTPANNSATDTNTLTPQADVSITKTDGQTSDIPGTSIIYTIIASNAGPSNAPAVTVADPFPASLTAVTWTCAGAGGGICTASGSGNLNDAANLPAGGSVTYTVNATILASATGTLSNTATATVGGGVTDPTPGNNSATDNTTLSPEADLSITKTDGATTAIPGTSVTYAIIASNPGPSNAPGSTVADTFPAAITGVTWTCVGAGGATCTAAGAGNINDTANLPAGGSVTYTASGTISASATGTLANTATVTAPGGVTDPTPGNNSATDTDTLTPQADLAITKTDGQTTAVPGQSVTYTIVASNAGPSNDPSATVADTFPATITGVTWTCVGAGGATCTAAGAGNINDTVNLPAGGSVTYTASGTISASATGTLVNTATVTSSVTDPTPANNSATDTNTLTPQADVSITKTDGQPSDVPGTGIVYTIVASNAGPSNAPSVTVADTFPATLSGVTWTCVGAGGATCAASGSGDINEGVNLPPGGSVTFTVNATITASATGLLSNTATASVGGGVTDPTPGNNSATDNTTLTPQADLSITKTDGLAVAIPGQSTTYTITVSNAGPSNAVNATVADTFPAALTGITWTCSGTGGGTCTAVGSGNINDTVNLPAGGSVTYIVNNTIDSGATGVISNTATVTAPGGVTDPDTSNNSATDTTSLDAPPVITAFTVTPGTINENGSVNLSVTFTDPNTPETHEVVINWGDGNSETINLPIGTLTAAASHQYLDDNPTGTPSDNNTVSVTVNEPDGGTDSDSTAVTVNNVAPTLSGVSATNVNENGSTTLTGSISDVGTQDTFTLVVNWGDGNSDTYNYAAGTTSFNETHQYLDDNPTGTPADNYTISLTLTDDDTGSDTDSDTITVSNVAPTLSNVAATATINEDGSVTLGGDITDPGTQDTFTLDVDWGDGNSETFNYGAGTVNFSETHQYLDDNPTGTPSDNVTISLTLTDDDTGSDTDNDSVTVNNVAPSLTNLAATPLIITETNTITLTGNIIDPGTQDTFTMTVDWADGNVQTVAYPAGTTAFTLTHTYQDDGLRLLETVLADFLINVTLEDDDTGSVSESVLVTVNNEPPTLSNVTINSPVNEGDTATLSGNISDISPTDSFTLVVDWGDGITETFSYGAGTTSFNETHVYVDDNPTGTPSDVYTVDLTLTDDNGDDDTDSLSVTVNNVAPTLTGIAASDTAENDVTLLTFTISDPGTADSFSLAVDWGDGNSDTFTYANSGVYTETHQYLDDDPSGTPSDSYTIGLALTDDDTGSDNANDTITVSNVAPVLSNVAATDGDENGTTTLTGNLTDVGTLDTFTVTVAWGDGINETFSYGVGSTSFSETHQYLDDDPSGTPSDDYTVTVTVTDDDTGVDNDTAVLTVTNLAPDLSNVAATPLNIDENSTITVTGQISDVSTLDSFTLVIDWADGITETFTYPAGTSSFLATHTYEDDGLRTLLADFIIGLTLTDDDTGSDSETVTVQVNNVPPTLNNVAISNPIDEGDTASLTGDIGEVSPTDSFTLTVAWGDGNVDNFGYGAGTTSFAESHVYGDDDPTGTPSDVYTVTMTLTDDNGGTAVHITNLTVNNVAPQLGSVTLTPAVDENDTATLTGSFTDPGLMDTFALDIEWGDGNSDTVTTFGPGNSFTVTHQYLDDDPTATPSDSYTVNLTLTDDDTGSASDTANLTVNNVAPVVDAGVDQSATANTAVTFNGTFSDIGTLDTHTIEWDFGDGNSASGSLTPTHTYTSQGVYTATLTITDDDTGTTSNEIVVTVVGGRVYLPIIMAGGGTPPAPDLVVSSLAATANNVVVTITNEGNAPVTDAFWVDAYINPDPIPTMVNQTWQFVADEGLVWGVTGITLNPGQSLTLTMSDAYYRADLSVFSGNMPLGTPVYAQVDSARAGSNYGNVLEDHEISGGAYNNIAGTTVE